ncbi:MAG: hypothetical protein HC821_03020 [Lewinella sp.]|nr:hypothetical protein [Lewinella sp.]
MSEAAFPIDLELALYFSTNNQCAGGQFRHLYSGRNPAELDEAFTITCLDPGRPYWVLVDGASVNSAGFFTLSVVDLGDIRPVFTQRDTVCAGGSIQVGSRIHTASGRYVDTLKIGLTNCDSIVITDLVVLAPISLNIVQTLPAIGAGGSNGQVRVVASGGSGSYSLAWCGGGSATPVGRSTLGY